MEHLEAVGWGILSASAFPIGCIFGLAWPKAPLWLRGALMNFGGGVMLSVLTVTLFGEWIFHPHQFGHGAASVLFVCSFVGGVLFLLLDSFLEQRGGWMRRLTAKRKRLMEWRARRVRPLLAKLRRKHPTSANRGSVAFLQRALEDELLEQLEREEGEVLGAEDDLEMTNVEKKERYLHITSWDVSAHATGDVGGGGDSLPLVIESKEDEANLPAEALEPVPHVHTGSLIGLAIWVGLLIDGIPESLVIGVESASHRGVMVSLRVAFFLGNLPVALSSSIVMFENGMSRLVILFMWLMLTAMTGVGALAGSFLQEPKDNEPNSGFLYGLAVAEGIAAGAMLVMISNVMMPEAYRTGGALSGIALLSGFLVGLCLELADFL